MLGSGPGDAAFRERLRADGRLVARLAAGDSLTLDGVPVLAWWPRRGSVPARAPGDGRAINDTSIVLDLRYGSRRFLLMGDVEDDVDPQLLAAGIADGGRADLLKVAHHGSRTASTDAFLTALRPRVAVASAGTGNPYGHPAPRPSRGWRATGARVLRTDLDGSVTVSTDGRDLRVERTGGRTVSAATIRELRVPPPGVSVAPRCRCRAGSPGACSVTPVSRHRPCRRRRRPRGPRRTARPRPPCGVHRRCRATPRGAWLLPRRARSPTASPCPCYDRPRDDPHPVRRGRHPARPRRTPDAAQPHARGRGGRRLPRRARRGPGGGRGPLARGERGAAPRPGQGPPRGRSAAPRSATATRAPRGSSSTGTRSWRPRWTATR